MFYDCTHMATVGVKGLNLTSHESRQIKRKAALLRSVDVRALSVVRFGSRTDERSFVVTSAICCLSVIKRLFCTRATLHRSAWTRRQQPPPPRSRHAWRRAMASPLPPRPIVHRPTTGQRPALTPPTRRRSTRSPPPGRTALGRRPVRRRRCRAAR